MRTITNEGLVEQEPGTVVHLPRRGSHLAQVRWGSHTPAAPYMQKKKWVTRAEEEFASAIAQTSGEMLEWCENSGGKSYACAVELRVCLRNIQSNVTTIISAITESG